ncbi:MAG: DUF2934 domain-containing protein [Steroidobacteraceae bacterium]
MQDEPRTIRAMRNFNPLRFCAPGAISAADRHRLISQAAYLRAKQRGFAAGHEVEDWLAAEREIDAQLPQYPP